MRNILKSLQSYNAARSAALLQVKYSRMNESSFRFYRGSCHLFYEDIHRFRLPGDIPSVWLCGDMHFENFGSFKGANKLIYFDINDFDEAFIGPAVYDVIRLITSIHLVGDELSIPAGTCAKLCRSFLSSYAANLTNGHSYMAERESAKGYVRKFLKQAEEQSSELFISKRADPEAKLLSIREGHTIALSVAEKQDVQALFELWQKQNPVTKCFKFLDAAFRIAGTGSIGVQRYSILAINKDNQHLSILEFKEMIPSCAIPYIDIKQPVWGSEAERVSNIQYRMQATAPEWLSFVTSQEKSFLIRKLQPQEDKLNMTAISEDVEKLLDIVNAMAAILAWDQLRSSGRQGSAIADELMIWAAKEDWQENVLSYSAEYAAQVKSDYLEFSEAFKKGDFIK